MPPASILVRCLGQAGRGRAALLRTAGIVKQACPSSAGFPAHVDVLLLDNEDEEAPRWEISPLRATLLIPARYLLAGLPPARQLEDFKKALDLPRRVSSPAETAEAARGTSKALFFRSLLNSADKELGANHMYQGVFYLASALKRAGFPFVLVDGRMSLEEGALVTDQESLDRALAAHPDINLVGLTLYDSYFEKAEALMRHIRQKGSRAFIAVGGLMPTQNPFETLAHMPELSFVVRGAGEDVLPRILKIIAGADASSGLDASRLEALRGLDGTVYMQEDALLLAGAEHTLRVQDLDASPLDFSILEKSQVASGTVLSISRGCPYHCYFCTSMDKGRFVGKSARDIANLLGSYGRRLLELYGRWSNVPQTAFAIGFYDDDLLSDRDWAISLFRLFRSSPFHIRFFQASISSFYLRENGRVTKSLDHELLDAMPEELFLPKLGGAPAPGGRHQYVNIGTENYCDEELSRLGKAHRYEQIAEVARELSRRKIHQAHHFIVANAETTPDNVMENLRKIASLRRECGPYYDVLRPVISRLVSFYSSPSYKRMQLLGLGEFISKRKVLAIPGFPEFDYPLVRHDLARDPDVRALADGIEQLSSSEADWPEVHARVSAFFESRAVRLEEVAA